MEGLGTCKRSAFDLKVSNEQSPIITYMTHNTSVSAKSPPFTDVDNAIPLLI